MVGYLDEVVTFNRLFRGMSDRVLIRWLQVACLLTAMLGLFASGGSYTPTQEPWRLLFDVVTWPLDGHPQGFTSETASVNAVVGGVMVGWAVLMFAVVTGPIARGDRGMIDAMLACVLTWFFIDSAGSVAADFVGNVVLNVGSMLAFVLPLLVLRSRA